MYTRLLPVHTLPHSQEGNPEREAGRPPHYRPAFSSLLSLPGPLQGTTSLLPFPHRGPELPFCPHGTAQSSRPSWSGDLLQLQEGPRAQWAGRVGEGGRFSFLFLWGPGPMGTQGDQGWGAFGDCREEAERRVSERVFTRLLGLPWPRASVLEAGSPRSRRGQLGPLRPPSVACKWSLLLGPLCLPTSCRTPVRLGQNPPQWPPSPELPP